MTKKRRCMVCSILLFAMFVALSVPALAATTQQVISLPADQSWVCAGSDTRSTSYSYTHARNHSVYPTSGVDLFSTIQCRITSPVGTTISSPSSLKEKAVDYTKVYIWDGYLHYSTVFFNFRGNTDFAANAIVSYDGL